jgi:uncharacterized protein (DUF2147 family)
MGKFSILLAFVMLTMGATFGFSVSAEDIIGEYYTPEKKSVIRIYKEGDTFSGQIISLKDPTNDDGTPKFDVENPDKELAKKPIIGLKLIWGFEFRNGEWVNGHIYNPEDGKTYFCRLQFNDNEKTILNVRGSIGRGGLIGRTQIWHRKFTDD